MRCLVDWWPSVVGNLDALVSCHPGPLGGGAAEAPCLTKHLASHSS